MKLIVAVGLALTLISCAPLPKGVYVSPYISVQKVEPQSPAAKPNPAPVEEAKAQ